MDANPVCKAYIQGDSQDDPSIVLRDLNRSNGIVRLNTDDGHAQTIRPGAGSGATIKLHNQFFKDDVGGLTRGGDSGNFSRNPTPFEARMLVIWHETRHSVTGEGGPKHSTTFYERIFNRCLR